MALSRQPFPDPSDGLLLGGVFTGIGGWELAAGDAWESVYTAECDKHARQVFEANFGEAPCVGDILAAPASSANFAHVYTVSFPCQSSSQAGKRRGRQDPRGKIILDKALDLLAHAQPTVVIFENVKGFVSVDHCIELYLTRRVLY